MTNTESNSSRSEKLIDFTVLCAWLITSITMAVIAYSQFGQDFRGYYAAGRVLLEGGNPYDYSKVAPILLEVTGRIGNNPFYYPLWFGWFITPLAWLPFQLARAIWMVFNLAAWILGLIRLRKLINWPCKGWQTWSMNLLTTILFAWTTWKFDQTSVLLFVIIVETLIAYRKKQFNRMGIYLAAALIKPNIMLLPVAIMALWLIRNKIFRPVIVMSVLLIGLVVITTILTPNWYQPIVQPSFGQGLTEVLDGPNKTTGVRLSTTMLDWLKMFQTPEEIRNMLYGFAVSIGLIVTGVSLWKTKSLMEITVISLLVNFAITPYALQYDYPPLVICMFWALTASSQIGSQKIPVVITSFIASVLIWERPISDGYWIVVGLCLLVVWSVKTNRNMQLSESLL